MELRFVTEVTCLQRSCLVASSVIALSLLAGVIRHIVSLYK